MLVAQAKQGAQALLLEDWESELRMSSYHRVLWAIEGQFLGEFVLHDTKSATCRVQLELDFFLKMMEVQHWKFPKCFVLIHPGIKEFPTPK